MGSSNGRSRKKGLTTDALDDVLYGTNGNDILTGGAGDNTIKGLKGNDRLSGGAGNDKLFGDQGHDVLFGGTGDDTLLGGDGDDRLYGGAGFDEYFGGNGNDRFYIDAEEIYRAYSETFSVFVNGGDGYDRVYLASEGELHFENFVGIEEAVGTNGNDFLDAWQQVTDVVLVGGAGDDVLVGGAGNDRLVAGKGSDNVIGNDGTDVIVFHGKRSDYWLDMTDHGSIVALDLRNGIDTDTIENVELFSFTDGVLTTAQVIASLNDTFTGTEDADTLFGGAGNDSLAGLAGEDILSGGSGNDVLAGGAGNDQIYGDDGEDVAVFSGVRANYFAENWLSGFKLTDLTGVDGSDEAAVEIYRFSDGDVLADDILATEPDRVYVGTDQDDFVRGGWGDDMVLGLAGNDWLSDPNGSNTLDGGAGDDTIFAGDGVSLLIGGSGNDWLNGAGDDDIAIFSGARSDYFADAWGTGYKLTDLAGDDGVDTINGVAVLRFTDGDVMVADLLTTEPDRTFFADADGGELKGGWGNDTLIGGAARDFIYGNNGNDSLVGGEWSDALSGDAGDDTLNGGSGNDLLDGGDGQDTVILSGDIADYAFTRSGGTQFLIADSRVDGDGVDYVDGVEWISFQSGAVWAVSDIVV